VVLICFHYSGEDETINRFLDNLREILDRYAKNVYGGK